MLEHDKNEPLNKKVTRIEQSLSRFLVLAMITLALFTILNTIAGTHSLAIIQGCIVLILPSLYIWLKRGGSITFVKHAVGFTTLAIFVPLLFLPTVESTGIYWTFTYPLVAFFFLGVRSGILWSSIYIIILLSGLLFAYLEFIPFYYSWMQTWLAMVELILACIISYFFVSDNEKAEEKLQSYVHYLKSVDHIERTLHSQLDIQEVMNNTLQALLETFQCNRAWLLYPCDPNATSWSIPFECTTDDFPGAHATGTSYAVDSTMRDFFIDAQNSKQPICHDDRNPFGKDSTMLQEFSIKSQMAVALRPNNKQTWILGLHQCDNDRRWSANEQRLFNDIARRMKDALQQMQLYEELKETTKQAKAASLAKSEFLSVMSHELRTPLHGIIGLQELIAVDAKQLSSEQLEHLTLAQQAARSLGELVNDILSLSKIESGNMQLNSTEFSLKEALLDACIPFIISCRNKKIPLILHLKSAPEFISTDPIRLRQVLINLIGNAVKFTKKGEINLIVEKKDEALIFTIKDTGIGISPDTMQKIFEPFHQEVQLMHDEHAGTGLGTTIAKRFVELMGGEISVQSELDVGTCFTFHIPCLLSKGSSMHWHADLAKMHKPSSNTPTELQQSNKLPLTSSIHILLAEDDPIGQRIAAKRLRRTGMLVDIAENGFSAWVKAQTGQYDLLLTDIRMPKLDGIALTERIRQHEKEHQQERLPIIGLSAHALEDIERQCLDAGMDAFMIKPIDPDNVLGKVQEIINHYKSSPPNNYSI